MKLIFTFLMLVAALPFVQAQKELNAKINNLHFPLTGNYLSSSSNNSQAATTMRMFKKTNWVENRYDEPNTALYISKDDAGISIGDLKMRPATRFTMAFWVKASKPQTVQDFFTTTSFLCDTATVFKAAVCVFPSFDFQRNNARALPAQEWFFMTICYKDGITEVYVNDETRPRIKHYYDNFDQLNANLSLGFGHIEEVERQKTAFIGSLNDLYVFNTTLTADERLKLYKKNVRSSVKEEPTPEPKPEPAPTPTPTPTPNNTIVARGAEQNAPQIYLSDKTRDLGISTKNSGNSLEISGYIIDQSPLKILKINDDAAEILGSDGFKTNFKYKVPSGLTGTQTFVILAADQHNNIATQVVTLNMEAPQKDEPQKDEPQPIVKKSTNLKSLDIPTRTSIKSAGFYALIIGVSEYEEEDMALVNTVRDAERVKDALLANYHYTEDNIMFLEDPDKEEVMEALAELKDIMGENDNLIIFYAGHGHWDKNLKKSYWLPADADKKNKANWISSTELADNLKEMEAQHVLVVSDACFSGGFLISREIASDDESVYNKLYSKKSRKVITSGDLETVPDESVFIEYFIKALEENSYTYLSSDDLFHSFKKAVIANSPKNEVPQMGVLNQSGDEGGSFIFYKK
jgi:hypothetical protein